MFGALDALSSPMMLLLVNSVRKMCKSHASERVRSMLTCIRPGRSKPLASRFTGFEFSIFQMLGQTGTATVPSNVIQSLDPGTTLPQPMGHQDLSRWCLLA